MVVPCSACHCRSVRHRGLLLVLFIALSSTACAGNRAYLDWRPGLSEADFEGLFEISLEEFDGFSEEAADNVVFDRSRGVARPDASTAMASLGEAVAATTGSDPRGYAIVSLGGDGSVSLFGDRGHNYSGAVDWLAITPDSRHAALLSGTKLAVAIDGASTGIDLGSLLGGSVGGYQVGMLVRDEELTVYVLPELGGVVTASEPGYLLAVEHHPGGREPWVISVARVAPGWRSSSFKGEQGTQAVDHAGQLSLRSHDLADVLVGPGRFVAESIGEALVEPDAT
jgi:hypothetical protein